jgi:hypothetical protein
MTSQASKKKCGLLPLGHQRIGSRRSNGINSEQLPVNFFMLTIVLRAPQASAQSP